MKIKTPAAAALLFAAAQAGAVTLTFDDIAAGATLSNQYAAQGATFTPNAFTGPGSSSSGMAWASNTDMTVVDSASSSAGALGSPSLVSGNILHSFPAWLSVEDGDASFRISFTNAVDSVSVVFAGVDVPADSRLFVYDGSTLLGTQVGSTTGQFMLSFAAPSITSVVVTPGSFNDWVGVDNVTYNVAAIPEPGTYALMALGLGVLLLKRRRAG